MSPAIKLFLSITNYICTNENRRQQFCIDRYFCLLFVFAFVYLCLFLLIIFNIILWSRLAKSRPAAFPCPITLREGKLPWREHSESAKSNRSSVLAQFFFSLYIHPHISEGGSRGVTSIIICHSYVGGWGTISATINCTKCIWKFAHTYLRPSDWHRRRNANILILKSSFYKFTWYLWI